MRQWYAFEGSHTVIAQPGGKEKGEELNEGRLTTLSHDRENTSTGFSLPFPDMIII